MLGDFACVDKVGELALDYVPWSAKIEYVECKIKIEEGTLSDHSCVRSNLRNNARNGKILQALDRYPVTIILGSDAD